MDLKLFIINMYNISIIYSYQSADGSQRQESGGLKYPSAPGYPPVLSVQGSYSAITSEGIIHTYYSFKHLLEFFCATI